jgi:IrrE N-terminal-like domain
MTPEQTAIIAQFQREAPIDITAMANGLGLIVYDDYELGPGISGMIQQDLSGESPSGYVISVNANEHYNRRRFTVAHECAHFLRHRDKIGDGIFDDAMYRSEKMNSQEEFEANNTAAELLMPRRLVGEYVRAGLSDISGLAAKFQVSEAAMRVRMRYIYRTT